MSDRDRGREHERAPVKALAPDGVGRAEVRLLREFDPASAEADDLDVPDPYYEGPDGFDVVLDQIQAACVGLLEHVQASERA